MQLDTGELADSGTKLKDLAARGLQAFAAA
jgi:hypothetical protein